MKRMNFHDPERGMAMIIKGVNLGNWLVLEKWMSPALFEGTSAEDEHDLPRQLSKEIYEARIRVHRSEYISEGDFLRIKAMGLNTVRIPVPFFIFGDVEPYIGCIGELDKAFNWAERYGLQILIDLHTVPGGQNGFDNGGWCGVNTWSQSPEKVEWTLQLLEKLAQRYGERPGLFGIQPLNEPCTEEIWSKMDVPNRYPAKDPGKARQSKPITWVFLEQFYKDVYESLRRYLPADKAIVYHDGFDITHWKGFMQGDQYKNVWLDTHQYLMLAEMDGCAQAPQGYTDYILSSYQTKIREMEQYFPVICGEWCLFNSLCTGTDTNGGRSVLNGEIGMSAESVSDEEKRYIYRILANAQLEAWRVGHGYFYWSYKTLTDTVNTGGWVGWDAWDLGRCFDLGWFPLQ